MRKNTTKILAILLLLAANYSILHAHVQPKRLLGSFVLKNKVYNYDLRLIALDNFELLISTLNDGSTAAPQQKKSRPENVVTVEQENRELEKITTETPEEAQAEDETGDDSARAD